MNYLTLNSTKTILKTVAANNGLLSWHGVVTYVDKLEGVELDPPSFFVLTELTRDGFLRQEPPEGGNSAKYWLTESGQALMSQFFSVERSVS